MSLETEPVHDVFGAQFNAIDVSTLDNALFEEVRQTVHKFGFGLFRNQRLTPSTIVELARRFGEPLPGYRPQFTHPDYPELVRLGNVKFDDGNEAYLNTQGIEWHSDGTGAVLPPNVTMLYAVETPEHGGDTLFASATASYCSLPDDMKRQVDGMKVVNSFDHHNDQASRFSGANFDPRGESLRSRNPDKLEALVQTHPATGESHLIVTHQMVKEVVGMPPEDGMQFIMQLVEHITQPQFVYQHHWEVGDLIVFDNRSTMHSATAYDYVDERRLMYQIIIGERAN